MLTFTTPFGTVEGDPEDIAALIIALKAQEDEEPETRATPPAQDRKNGIFPPFHDAAKQ